MKTISYTYEIREDKPKLFKKDVKLMDINIVTHLFLMPKKLERPIQHEIMVRINNNTFSLGQTLHLYSKRKAIGKATYGKIAQGLKETLRRVRISLALDKNYNGYVVEYWPYVASVLKKDAELIKDERLYNIASEFEKYALALKAN